MMQLNDILRKFGIKECVMGLIKKGKRKTME